MRAGTVRLLSWLLCLLVALSSGCSPQTAPDDMPTQDEAGAPEPEPQTAITGSPAEALGPAPTSPAGTPEDERGDQAAPGVTEEHGGDCPASQGFRAHEQFGYAFGRGPVYSVLGTPGHGAVLRVEDGGPRVDGMRVTKIMWIADPSFAGDATVTASAPDEGGFLLSVDATTDPAEPSIYAFRSDVTLSQDEAGTAADDWLFWPSSGAFAGPGCHGLTVTVDGREWTVTFDVIFD